MRLTLTQARELRGWTVDQLADHSGIHRTTIYRLEAGDIEDPKNTLADKLEQSLSLKPRTLVFGPDAKALAS